MFPLTCSAIHPPRWFWCQLPSFGDIGCRDVCFLSNIMELDGIRSAQKILTKYPTTMSLSRNRDLVSHHAEGSESQLLLWPNCVITSSHDALGPKILLFS